MVSPDKASVSAAIPVPRTRDVLHVGTERACGEHYVTLRRDRDSEPLLELRGNDAAHISRAIACAGAFVAVDDGGASST